MIKVIKNVWRGHKYLILIVISIVIAIYWANGLVKNQKEVFGFGINDSFTGTIKLVFHDRPYNFFYVAKVRDSDYAEYEYVKEKGMILDQVIIDNVMYYCFLRSGGNAKEGYISTAWLDRCRVVDEVK